MAKVIVKPLEIKKWHGKYGKESFTKPKTIEVLYDTELNRFATGMTREEEEEYSKKLGVDLSGDRSPYAPHPFYSTKAAKIPLKNETMIFNTENPWDYVKVKNLKASKFVANSMKEYEEGLFPHATHVIYDEEEEVASKASKIELQIKAMNLFAKMTSEAKAQIIQILDNKTVRGKSLDYLNVATKELLDRDPEQFVKYASMDKEEVYIRATLLEGLSKDILTKEGTGIYYMSEFLGVDMEETIKWFKNPQNSKMKVAILEKLNG